MPFSFDNTYAQLPDAFYSKLAPVPVKAPRWIALNHGLAQELGIDTDALDSEEGLEFLSGNVVPPGADPLAMAYAGHQFGGFVPQLGDGRALLMGEVIGKDGLRRDIQWKGSGPTPFSRRGDGRSALGPVLREYLVSEGMAALGVPTTRALAAVWTGETVWREEREPGGVFVRVAASHLRIGTAQYLAAREDTANLQVLVEYAIRRHDSEAAKAENPALALLEGVCRRQARLVAQWLGIGFIHGVMNTDNMTLSGETIDYGPCAFLDAYDPNKTFSFIDQNGRYAYGHQPIIAQWNLARLAEALLPVLIAAEDGDQEIAVAKATAVIEAYPSWFEKERDAVFASKLGFDAASEDSFALMEALLALMQAQKVDFTLAFRHLCGAIEPTGEAQFIELFACQQEVTPWLGKWRSALAAGDHLTGVARRMRQVNPAIIPRNHRVEEAIQAGRKGDFGPFERLLEALQHPYEERQEHAAYMEPPEPNEEVTVTFCGT